jgi:hypothetical protein
LGYKNPLRKDWLSERVWNNTEDRKVTEKKYDVQGQGEEN